MATGEKKPAGDTLAVRVYIWPSAGRDGQLLQRAVQSTRNQSGFLQSLILRGWIDLLHGTTAEERSIFVRSAGLSDDLVAEIDAMVANPKFFELRHRDAQDLGAATPVAPAASAPAPAAVIPTPPSPPPVAPAPPAFVLPEESRLGSIGEGGGLA
jgi:hypothetical protein